MAACTLAANPADFTRVIVDMTVQPKAIAFSARYAAVSLGARAPGAVWRGTQGVG